MSASTRDKSTTRNNSQRYLRDWRCHMQKITWRGINWKKHSVIFFSFSRYNIIVPFGGIAMKSICCSMDGQAYELKSLNSFYLYI